MSGYKEDLWSFLPESGATMNVEFSTQIIQAYDYSEQRISRRAQPRYEFVADYYLLGQDVQQAKALLHSSTPASGTLGSGLGSARMPWYDAPDIRPSFQSLPSNTAAQFAFDNPGTPVVTVSNSQANKIYWVPGGNIGNDTFPPFSQWYILNGGHEAGDPTQGYMFQIGSTWTYEEIGTTGNFVNEASLSWGNATTNPDPDNSDGPFIPPVSFNDVYAYPILFGYLEGSLSTYRSAGNDVAIGQVKFSVQDTNRGPATFSSDLDRVENFRREDALGHVLDVTESTLFPTNFHADAANGGYPLVDAIPYLQESSTTSSTTFKPNQWNDNNLSTRYQTQRYGSEGPTAGAFIGANPTTSELNFVCETKDEAIDLLRWLRSMRGKQKCFWRRSWSADFAPLDMGTLIAYDPGNPTLERILLLAVEPNGFGAPSGAQAKRLFWGSGSGFVNSDADNIENRPYQCISLRFADGTYHNTIVRGVTGDEPGEIPTFSDGKTFPGKHVLTLEWDLEWVDPFSNTHTPENLMDVSYLHLCRFAEDTFSIQKDEVGNYYVNTKILEGIKNVV